MPYLNDMPLEARLAMLNRRDADRQPQDILKPALALLVQRIALVGSFGAEPAVLLHMAAQIASKPTLRAGHWPGQSKTELCMRIP
jgi:3'-phosphoadenosine 5'-phosphosulfate sulfotransferase (PAPS reductase)/FAD synthetase